ncbi:MAG: ABC transporter ATP-binding protein [Tissierellia bacterium]|nr:ABC transporter ATP-binding protein [Tissierellia bacterium]
MNEVLRCENVSIQFGGLKAIDNLNMHINSGELLGLIGPNGAGKTTVFNMISGEYSPTEGKIYLCGEKINGLRPHILVKKGIARTFQNIRLFGYLSALENVKVACNKDMSYSIPEGMLRMPKYWSEEKNKSLEALKILDIMGLKHLADAPAKSLSYGDQRKLEIARALATKPKLLLLDEPAAGMNPNETMSLMYTIETIRDRFGITVLLIEHDMNLVLGICERLMVLNYGKTLAVGKPNEVVNNKDVITAYLGNGGD